MRFCLFIGVFLFIFLSTPVAAKIGITKVGSFSSIILVTLFFAKFFADTENKLLSIFRAEFNIIIAGFFILVMKIVLGQLEQTNQVIFLIIVPMFISVLLGTQTNDNRRMIQVLILFFFVLECSLAIYERITLNIVFPSSNESDIFLIKDWAFRSTSFLGHPLNNALCVSVIMGFILCSNIKSIHKISYLMLGFVSLLCFNARAAVLIWMFLLTVHIVKIIFDIKTKQRARIFLGFFLIFLFYSVSKLILDYGIGSRVAKEAILDGSANTRLNVFDSFKYINKEDLIFGDASNYLIVMKKLAAGGIENSYIVLIVDFGIFMTLILILLYHKLISRFLNNYSLYDKLIIVCSFLLLGSSNNGLASSVPWGFFILCFYAFTKFDGNIKNVIGRVN